jgi:hypothetical protein
LFTLGIFATDIGTVVVIDSVLKGFYSGLVAEFNNITVIDVNIEASLLRELVESVVEVFTMGNILLEAEDSPLSKMDWLLYDRTEDLGVV